MKRKKIGSKLLVMALALAAALSAAGKKSAAEPHGILGGTVFRDSGFALPGAEVTLAADPEPGQAPIKMKKQRVICNNRGEFAFRVPVTAMRYKIRVSASGYLPQEKQVEIEGEQRIDATFQLTPKSK